jgi:hypothetical protein
MTAAESEFGSEAEGVVDVLPDGAIAVEQVHALEEHPAIRSVVVGSRLLEAIAETEFNYATTVGILFESETVVSLGWEPESSSWQLLHRETDPDDVAAAVDRAERAARDWVQDGRIYDERAYAALRGDRDE